MTFDTILGQVLTLLQQEKRVSYRALKRRFALDDDYLEDLKDELIYAKKLATDEENRVLVWIGEEEATTRSASPPAAHHPPEAERRQLTVMFCALVGSTRLSSQLDPEEYRAVVHAYHAACTAVIQRYEGYIAQLLGDGLLVYFGYPVAHDEEAHRAVHTGLSILAAVKALNPQLAPTGGITLAVRLGIHTGLVVVGAMGGNGRQEQLALGETPNIAARLQALAEPDTLYISAATYRLLQGHFECQELGEYVLRGVAEPVLMYRVLRESEVLNRLEVAAPRGLTPLVGRESEAALLLDRWARARDGPGQVVLLNGEGGIGKSRLMQVLKEHIASAAHARWECRSSPYYHNTARR